MFPRVIFIVTLMVIGAGGLHYTRGERSEKLVPAEEWANRIRLGGPLVAREEFFAFSENLNAAWQHANGHAFGRALYATYGPGGLLYCSERVHGCVHEVVGRRTFHSDSASDKQCAALEAFERLECEHGMGHGFILRYGYTQEGLHKSMARCDEMGTLPDIQGCTYGVVMEWYLRFLSERSQLRPKDDDAVLLCEEFSGAARSSCFYHITFLWFNELDELSSREALAYTAARCSSLLDAQDQADCVLGLGRAIATLGVLDPSERSTMCVSLLKDSPVRHTCELGARQFGVHIDHADRSE